MYGYGYRYNSGLVIGAGGGAPFNTKSLSFDGVDDYVQTSGVYSELDGLNNYAFSFWMKPQSISRYEFILSIGMPSGDYRASQFQLYSANGYIFMYFNGVGYYARSNTVITANIWQHILVTRDSTRAVNDKVRIYINGVNETATDNTRYLPILVSADTGLYIREHQGGWYSPFLGNLDEVAIYTQDVASYVSDIYGGGIAVDLNNLLSAPQPTSWYRNGDNGSWKSPQWLIPNNENKDKVSNYSFDFDGVDDSVSLSSSVNLGINSTISFWIKRGRVATEEVWLGESTYQYFYSIFITSTRTLAFRIGTVYVIWDSTTVKNIFNNTNSWVNVCVVRSGNSVELFLNGASMGVKIGVGSLIDTMFDRIGDRYSGARTLAKFDEVAGWNTNTINPLDIYNGGIPTTLPSGAVVHYKMGEEATFSGGVWTVPDAVGSNTGTSANMTIEDRIGEAPNSNNNAVSLNMDEVDRVTDVPT